MTEHVTRKETFEIKFSDGTMKTGEVDGYRIAADGSGNITDKQGCVIRFGAINTQYVIFTPIPLP
jgi:hypothetical protein